MFPTKPLTDADLELPNYLCDGGGTSDSDFSNFEERINFTPEPP